MRRSWPRTSRTSWPPGTSSRKSSKPPPPPSQPPPRRSRPPPGRTSRPPPRRTKHPPPRRTKPPPPRRRGAPAAPNEARAAAPNERAAPAPAPAPARAPRVHRKLADLPPDQLVVMVVILLVLAFALPFLSGFQNIIGLLIIFFGAPAGVELEQEGQDQDYGTVPGGRGRWAASRSREPAQRGLRPMLETIEPAVQPSRCESCATEIWPRCWPAAVRPPGSRRRAQTTRRRRRASPARRRPERGPRCLAVCARAFAAGISPARSDQGPHGRPRQPGRSVAAPCPSPTTTRRPSRTLVHRRGGGGRLRSRSGSSNS